MKTRSQEKLESAEMEENENIRNQNLGDTGKTIFIGKFRVVRIFIKTEERSQINNLIFLKIGKGQTKPKVRRKIKRKEINEIEKQYRKKIFIL